MYNKCKDCGKVRDCNLRKGFRDLCQKQPPQIFAAKLKLEREGVPNPRYEGKFMTIGHVEPYNELGQLVERSNGRAGRQSFIALKRLLKPKPNGHDEDQPTSWEDYSATPYQSTHDHTPYWIIPDERNLRATEAGFEVITRKQKKLVQHLAEQERRKRFMIRHGFKLKDELQWLIVNNPIRAKTAASMLKHDDWRAIDLAGGLRAEGRALSPTRGEKMKVKITLKDGTETFRDIKPDGTVGIGPKDDIPVDRIKPSSIVWEYPASGWR